MIFAPFALSFTYDLPVGTLLGLCSLLVFPLLGIIERQRHKAEKVHQAHLAQMWADQHQMNEKMWRKLDAYGETINSFVADIRKHHTDIEVCKVKMETLDKNLITYNNLRQEFDKLEAKLDKNVETRIAELTENMKHFISSQHFRGC